MSMLPRVYQDATTDLEPRPCCIHQGNGGDRAGTCHTTAAQKPFCAGACARPFPQPQKSSPMGNSCGACLANRIGGMGKGTHHSRGRLRLRRLGGRRPGGRRALHGLPGGRRAAPYSVDQPPDKPMTCTQPGQYNRATPIGPDSPSITKGPKRPSTIAGGGSRCIQCPHSRGDANGLWGGGWLLPGGQPRQRPCTR
jgi:hypothetical protein